MKTRAPRAPRAPQRPALLLLLSLLWLLCLCAPLPVAADTPSAPDTPPAPATPPPPPPAIDFNDYQWSLAVQDLLLHRGKNFIKVFNDNQSEEISQSAIIKRFALRYKLLNDLDLGASLQLSLRDEATLVGGVATDIYHPFKAASVLSGYMLWSITLSRVRVENWLNLRLNVALSERILTLSTLQADLEIVLAFNGDALVTFGGDLSANLDDGFFTALQYGVGWRF